MDIKIKVSPQTHNGLIQDGRTADDLVAIAERDFASAKREHDRAWEAVNAIRAKVKSLCDALREAEAYATEGNAASLMSMREILTLAHADLEVAQESFSFASSEATRAEGRLRGALAYARAVDLFTGSVESHTHAEAVALVAPQVDARRWE